MLVSTADQVILYRNAINIIASLLIEEHSSMPENKIVNF